jgi:hypothetical protein
MTPIGQPCACEPMTWLYFVFVQSVFVFVGQTLAAAANETGVRKNDDKSVDDARARFLARKQKQTKKK